MTCIANVKRHAHSTAFEFWLLLRKTEMWYVLQNYSPMYIYTWVGGGRGLVVAGDMSSVTVTSAADTLSRQCFVLAIFGWPYEEQIKLEAKANALRPQLNVRQRSISLLQFRLMSVPHWGQFPFPIRHQANPPPRFLGFICARVKLHSLCRTITEVVVVLVSAWFAVFPS